MLWLICNINVGWMLDALRWTPADRPLTPGIHSLTLTRLTVYEAPLCTLQMINLINTRRTSVSRRIRASEYWSMLYVVSCMHFSLSFPKQKCVRWMLRGTSLRATIERCAFAYVKNSEHTVNARTESEFIAFPLRARLQQAECCMAIYARWLRYVLQNNNKAIFAKNMKATQLLLERLLGVHFSH